eukprot:scaffold4859_cov128-Isochrysis_galbana.AAC.9
MKLKCALFVWGSEPVLLNRGVEHVKPPQDPRGLRGGISASARVAGSVPAAEAEKQRAEHKSA